MSAYGRCPTGRPSNGGSTELVREWRWTAFEVTIKRASNYCKPIMKLTFLKSTASRTKPRAQLRGSGNDLLWACFGEGFMDDIICLAVSRLDRFFLAQTTPSKQTFHVIHRVRHAVLAQLIFRLQ